MNGRLVANLTAARRQTSEAGAVSFVSTPSPTFGGDPDAIEDLRARVADLEAENARLLARYASVLESENQRIRESISTTARGGSSAAEDVHAVATDEQRRPQLTAAALARDLTRVEDQLADVERLVATGDIRGAARARVAAATLACTAFSRACDDADFRQRTTELDAHPMPPDGSSPSELKIAFSNFRSAEITVLEIAGLRPELAAKHVDAAIEAFEAEQTSTVRHARDVTSLLYDLRTLRDATCEGAEMLAFNLRREASRARWRKLLTYGLGGTLIVAANGLGAALLGPTGVAVSQAIGSAAVGVAVTLVEA